MPTERLERRFASACDDVSCDGVSLAEGCLRVSDAGCELLEETVALEVPVSLSYNNVYFDVTTATPNNLEDLAYGVSFARGVIACAEDVVSVEVVSIESSYDINIVLRPGLRVDPSLCKLSSVTGLPRQGGCFAFPSYYPACMKHVDDSAAVSPSAIWSASLGLLDRQGMHKRTGATHAAAFVGRDGAFHYLREDVGRHNALDKLIGCLLRNKVDPLDGFAFLSSRCALDLVNKAARYGIGVVATVSAPTSAVIQFAREANITLCAFARGRRFTIYTHPERISLEDACGSELADGSF